MTQHQANESGRKPRLSPKRQRKLIFLRIHETWKTWAWRITALWCWTHLLDCLVFRNTWIGKIESRAFIVTFGWVSGIGFHPSSEHAFEFVLKALWLAAISTFSIGLAAILAIYVALWPLLVPFIIKYRRTIAEGREKALHNIISQPILRPVPVLISCIFAWFILFEGTTAPGPLLIAVLLSGALLIVAITRSFIYATSVEARPETRVHLLFRALSGYVIEVLKGINVEGPPLKQQLRHSKPIAQFFLWCARKASVLTYGRAGRRRANMFVLAEYLLTLSALGILTVLFWAFVIRYSLAPAYVPMRSAVLAAAAHVIPGVEGATRLHVNANLQIFASATAWLLLVLFAGPAASNYPALQDKFIREMRSANASIRLDRRRLYLWIHVSEELALDCEQHPEHDPAWKILLILFNSEKFGGLDKWQPDLARALADNHQLVAQLKELIDQLGSPLPASLARYIPDRAVENSDTTIEPSKKSPAMTKLDGD